MLTDKSQQCRTGRSLSQSEEPRRSANISAAAFEELAESERLLHERDQIKARESATSAATVEQILDRLKNIQNDKGLLEKLTATISDRLLLDVAKLKDTFNEIKARQQSPKAFGGLEEEVTRHHAEVTRAFGEQNYLRVVESTKSRERLQQLLRTQRRRLQYVALMSQHSNPPLSLLDVELTGIQHIYVDILERYLVPALPATSPVPVSVPAPPSVSGSTSVTKPAPASVPPSTPAPAQAQLSSSNAGTIQHGVVGPTAAKGSTAGTGLMANGPVVLQKRKVGRPRRSQAPPSTSVSAGATTNPNDNKRPETEETKRKPKVVLREIGKLQTATEQEGKAPEPAKEKQSLEAAEPPTAAGIAETTTKVPARRGPKRRLEDGKKKGPALKGRRGRKRKQDLNKANESGMKDTADKPLEESAKSGESESCNDEEKALRAPKAIASKIAVEGKRGDYEMVIEESADEADIVVVKEAKDSATQEKPKLGARGPGRKAKAKMLEEKQDKKRRKKNETDDLNDKKNETKSKEVVKEAKRIAIKDMAKTSFLETIRGRRKAPEIIFHVRSKPEPSLEPQAQGRRKTEPSNTPPTPTSTPKDQTPVSAVPSEPGLKIQAGQSDTPMPKDKRPCETIPKEDKDINPKERSVSQGAVPSPAKVANDQAHKEEGHKSQAIPREAEFRKESERSVENKSDKDTEREQAREKEREKEKEKEKERESEKDRAKDGEVRKIVEGKEESQNNINKDKDTGNDREKDKNNKDNKENKECEREGGGEKEVSKMQDVQRNTNKEEGKNVVEAVTIAVDSKQMTLEEPKPNVVQREGQITPAKESLLMGQPGNPAQVGGQVSGQGQGQVVAGTGTGTGIRREALVARELMFVGEKSPARKSADTELAKQIKGILMGAGRWKEKAEKLVEFLGAVGDLYKLQFEGVSLIDITLRCDLIISYILQRVVALPKLKFKDVAANQQSLATVLSSIQPTGQLTALSFDGVAIDSSMELLDCVTTVGSLRRLSLTNCSLKFAYDTRNGDLARMLGGSALLTAFKAKNCNLVDKDTEHIAQALKTNTTLRKLDLSENSITTEGMKCILESCRTNLTLDVFVLRGTFATPENIDPAIIRALATRPHQLKAYFD